MKVKTIEQTIYNRILFQFILNPDAFITRFHTKKKTPVVGSYSRTVENILVKCMYFYSGNGIFSFNKLLSQAPGI